MRKWLAVLCLLMLPCIVLANESDTVHELPTEVLEYIENRWSDYELEDYLEHPDMVEGNYSFALIWANDTRYLLGFCQENGVMKNWLDSAAAVPQTERKASLYRYEPGTQMNYIWDSEDKHVYVIGENIGVSVPDQWYETVESSVYFEWTGEGYCLKSYRDHFWDVDIVGDTLYFWDIGNGLRNQVKTWVQTDICHVDFASLPKRADDIVQDASAEAVIPRDALADDLWVDPLSMQGGDWYTLGEDYELTDDPLSSKAALCELPKNVQVEGMMKLGYVWTYVRVTMGEKTWWGFVPSELLGRG